MEVNVYKIKDIDIREVSAFIMKVKKASGLQEDWCLVSYAWHSPTR